MDPNCNKHFPTVYNMNRHYNQLHLAPKLYPCLNCPEQFKRKNLLKRHIFVHTGTYPHICTICDKGFVNLKSFHRHKTTHLAGNSIRSCQDCSEIFNTWTALVNHRRTAHAVYFECDLCSKMFCNKTNIKKHLKLHSTKLEDLVVFQCHYENCPKFYVHARNLKSHIRSKHERRKFCCDYCNSQLETKQKLQQHIKMHIGVQTKTIRKKKPERNPRKDMGTKKVSAIAMLSGLKLDTTTQKKLLNNCGAELKIVVPACESTTDQSDYDSSFYGN